VVSVGFGSDRGGEAIIFTPKYIDVSVGDTVIWRDVDGLEPHTVGLGPMSLLKKLVKDNIMPLRQKSGASLLALNPKVANATPGNTYDGTGFANSGFLTKGKTWRLTFTRPGTYHYLCLTHGRVRHSPCASRTGEAVYRAGGRRCDGFQRQVQCDLE
jgi:plastocyanin